MDAILIHSPSDFDFRTNPVLTGHATDGIPTSAVFEMYPMGLLSLVAALQKNGRKGRIVNLALKMMDKPQLDVAAYLRKLRAPVFGFDLHWMVHAPGALRAARLVKELHPDAFVVFGGFTASYFARELLAEHPFIDAVLRGDSTEAPFVELVERRLSGASLTDVPNLLWRSSEAGALVDNGLTHVPETVTTDFSSFPFLLLRMMFDSRSLDVRSFLPSGFYFGKPVVPVAFARGCVYRCAACGFSQHAMKQVCNRDRVALKDPDAFVDEILRVDQSYDFSLRIFGDIRIGGRRYWTHVLDRLAESPVKSMAWLELFTPADQDFLDRLDRAFEHYVIELSPESADEDVRRAQGRPYGNAELQWTMESLVARPNCELITLWFQIGNGRDTEESVRRSVQMCADMTALDPEKVHAFISPLAPYVDPGSLAFEKSAEHGYRLLHPDLGAQIQGFRGRTWLSGLNYETEHLDRRDIVRLSYDAARELNRHKQRLGHLSEELLHESNALLDESEALVFQLDDHLTGRVPDDTVEERVREFVARTATYQAKRANTPVFFRRVDPRVFLRTGAKWARFQLRRALAEVRA